MLQNDRETYEKFYDSFGLQLKYGVYADYGAHKDDLKDLILFYSSSQKKRVSLAEYTAAMKEGQKYIYYAAGGSVEKIDHLPQTELLKDKGYEILYLTDDIDEFALRVLHAFEDKEFRSVSGGDLGLEEEAEQKKQAEEQSEAHKELFEAMTKALDGKVKAVRPSAILKTHPVCLSTDGELSLEMEKVLNSMPVDQKVKAERVLELNSNHPVFKTLCGLAETDPEKLAEYAKLLYDQALLIEGMSIEDPVAFSQRVCTLMAGQ